MKKLSQIEIDTYIVDNQLGSVIDFSENSDYKKKANDTIAGKLQIPFPPEKGDLVRLHSLIRKRKPFTVLEFGVGYSTAIIADALAKNEIEWLQLKEKPLVRNRFPFQLFSVDASKKWINLTRKKIPTHLRDRVHISYSGVSISTFKGQLCHFYEVLPDVVPDFIYVDAPDTKQVKGKVHGLSFQCDERTVMSADLLLMEPTLLPGTFILVDGRTNNARFLDRNFTRPFKYNWHRSDDISTFELNEESLGAYNFDPSAYYPQP